MCALRSSLIVTVILRVCFVSVRTLNNYMISRVVKTFSSYLSKPFQKIKDDFIRILFGQISIFFRFFLASKNATTNALEALEGI